MTSRGGHFEGFLFYGHFCEYKGRHDFAQTLYKLKW
jgi:hypothetical protein